MDEAVVVWVWRWCKYGADKNMGCAQTQVCTFSAKTITILVNFIRDIQARQRPLVTVDKNISDNKGRESICDSHSTGSMLQW